MWRVRDVTVSVFVSENSYENDKCNGNGSVT